MISNVTFGQAVKAISNIGGYIFEEASSPEMRDRSIIVKRGDCVAAVIPVFIRQGIACHIDGTSIIPYYNDALIDEDILITITDWLCRLLEDGDAKAIKILPGEAMLRLFQNKPFLAIEDNVRLYGYYDLTLDRSDAWSSIRRRYKSRINRGAKVLRRTVYGHGVDVAEDVIDFLLGGPGLLGYDLTASAVENYLARVEKGSALLFEYRKDERIVGIVGIGEWKKFAERGHYYYDIGAYDHHTLLPLHYCLYDAITYHRDMKSGSRVYLLHGIPLQRPKCELKLSNIDFFKKGFCTHFFTRDYKILSMAGNQVSK